MKTAKKTDKKQVLVRAVCITLVVLMLFSVVVSVLPIYY
jgi:uncharacterized membrane protein